MRPPVLVAQLMSDLLASKGNDGTHEGHSMWLLVTVLALEPGMLRSLARTDNQMREARLERAR
jgi:hypothetical protein